MDYACQNEHEDSVYYIITQTKCQLVKEEKSQVLFLGCSLGNLKLICYMFESYNCTIEDCITKESSLLHCACQFGHKDIVKFLIKKMGFNPQIRDRDQRTPLHYACQYGHPFTASFLLSQGCSTEVKDHHQLTPVNYACLYGQTTVVNSLINSKHIYASDPFVECFLTHTSEHIPHLVHLAYQYGQLDLLKYMFAELKWNVYIQNAVSYTHLTLPTIYAV